MNKTILFIFTLVLSSVFLTSCVSSETQPTVVDSGKSYSEVPMNHNFKQLKLQDVDQMTEILYEKAEEYRQTDDINKLREGVQIAFSKTNEDGIIDKVISIVKTPLEDRDEWENSLEALVDTNMKRMSDDNVRADLQVTAGIVLENIVAEIKPKFTKQYETGGFETQLMERIAQSNIGFSEAAQKERKLNLMKTTVAPSILAQRLIEKKLESMKKK